MCICAVGIFFAGVYAKPLARFYKRLFTRKKRNDITLRMDELEKQINNLSKTLSMREKNRDNKVKKAVLEYLKELQK